MNKENLGQVFTPDRIVDEMIGLIEREGSVLEPSAGNGMFLNRFENAVAIEIDPQYATDKMLNIDFFDFSIENQFDTIIGNPPYVKYNEMYQSTKDKLPDVLDGRANLYLHFMYKCIDHLKDNGEMIFIVPRDFIKNTSSIPLNSRLATEGSFTYWRETGDEIIFAGATPNTVIFRWEKNNHENPLKMQYLDGQLMFGDVGETRLGDIFDVKVGGASGCNDFFISDEGNIDLVVSSTFADGETKKAHYYLNIKELPEIFTTNKQKLMDRKIKTFNEGNWFEWGRKMQVVPGDRIYVNAKTRHQQPFYKSSCIYYDGSVLGLIPKDKDLDLDAWVDKLNNVDWEQYGFKVGGRLVFSQRALENIRV